jgi:hypothetical protein
MGAVLRQMPRSKGTGLTPYNSQHEHQTLTCTGNNSGLHRGFGRDLTASSARESSHHQCQLTIGCHLDGSPINPLHVFRGAGRARFTEHPCQLESSSFAGHSPV